MLFIISSNNKAPQETHTGTLLETTQTGMTQEKLDSLIEKMDVQDETSDEDEVSSEDEISEDTSMEDEKEWFFSKLFSKKETQTGSEDDSQDQWDTVLQNDKQENLVKTSEKKEVSVATQNAVANYAPEILSQKQVYPGMNLETAIGKEFEVGVHSLKLNNKYFNETLGYIMQGDSLKQLSSENSYGCFEVEVLAAKNTANTGKTWYVCKKYLQDVQNENEVIKTPAASYTKVGDVITVEKTVTFGNGIDLEPGDQIDQMTSSDENGCFMAHVYNSVVSPDVVPVGVICMKDIK